MPGLEYIVRPFQQPLVSFPILVEDESTLADPVIVHLTNLGNAVTFAWSSSSSLSGSAFKEIERDTRKVKIENPDDPSCNIEVERAKKITVAETTNPANKLSWTLKDPQT